MEILSVGPPCHPWAKSFSGLNGLEEKRSAGTFCDPSQKRSNEGGFDRWLDSVCFGHRNKENWTEK
jgi:hypothetical protein